MCVFNMPFYFYLMWLFVISVITFFMYHYDKRLAIIEAIRIQEWRLLVMTILGGGIGAICAMLLFDHKTSKMLFQIVVPLSIIIQLGIAVFLKLYFDALPEFTIDIDLS